MDKIAREDGNRVFSREQNIFIKFKNYQAIPFRDFLTPEKYRFILNFSGLKIYQPTDTSFNKDKQR